MTERERLIELITEAHEYWLKYVDDCAFNQEPLSFTFEQMFADHLLANGVIVPPCKVGDNVYSFDECSCEDIDGVHTKCEFYGYGEDDMICAIPCGAKCPYQYRIIKCYVTEANILMFSRKWGKTVFPTKEEAEKALERSEGK